MKHKNLLKIALFFLVISGVSYGQDILTFEFSALAGNEATANSNSNDANIASSTISRGAGLTASTNGGRFNATGWSATSIADAVSNDDYMEFTITPNATFQFSVSSITINLERSSSGPSAVALRSSEDNYASNLDAEKAITDNTSTQSFTFTFAQSNSTVAVTYRFYMYAESPVGSGGIGDGAGNDIVVNGTVTAASADPVIGFGAATSSENETDVTFTSANIPISVINYSGSQIDINVSATVGAAEIGDYTFTSPTALSFTANETKNITVDINDDADYDDETIIFTITETSSVTGLIISQATHTLTIVDDEVPPVPTVGNVFISEVSEGNATGTEFIEIYNNSNEAVSMYNSKLVMLNDGTVYDFGTDLANINIPARGFLIITRGGDQALFEAENGTLNANTVFIQGSSGLFIGAGTARRWQLYTGGTFNIADGTLIDDTITTVAGGGNRHYQDIFTDTFILDTDHTASTPGALEYLVYNGGAWVNGVAMDGTTAAKNVYIYDNLTLSSNAQIYDLGIASGGSLTINSGVPLIVNGTSSGNVTYNRNLGTENWYLVSSPVVGEAYDNNYIAANSLAINGANNAIGSYTTADNTWSYMQTGGGATFTAGQGYSVRRATSAGAGNISFTGTINTADVSFAALTGYNLLGNPFTSYLNGVSFINGNSANIDGSQIWVWNQANGNYDVKNLVTTIDLAPAQGFFVNTTGSATVNMAKSYQQSTGSAFQKTAKTEVQLLMTDGTNNRYAKVFYLDNGTTGFDNGYDGETFGGIQNSFDVFTHLVANSEGKKFQIQSLPNSDFENMVVPVGIKAAAGKEITFSAEAMNIPDGINVYLEDRTANTVTLLSEANATYKVTLTESLDGIGRFYLHTKASGVLSTTEVALDNISIYSPAKSTLRIAGVSQGKASVKIYSVLGKQVFANTYNTTGVIDMNLPTLTTGLYVVQLETEKGTLNKKITLE